MPILKSQTTPLSIILASALLASPLTTLAEPPAKEQGCRACHGAQGAAPIAPNYPKLNGQNAAYLVSAMNAYRSGQRKGGLAAAMAAQAAQLSDEEIAALADYYAAQ